VHLEQERKSILTQRALRTQSIKKFTTKHTENTEYKEIYHRAHGEHREVHLEQERKCILLRNAVRTQRTNISNAESAENAEFLLLVIKVKIIIFLGF